jgi:hypothetical protein
MAAKVQKWFTSGLAVAALFLSGEALASPVITTIHDGNNAGLTRRGQDGRERQGNEYQAGIEQTDVVQLANGRIIAVGTSSYTNIDNVVTNQRGNGTRTRVQALCVAGDLNAQNQLQVQTMRHVTNNNGNEYRNANHTAAIPILNGQYAALIYNYQPNSDTEQYVTVVDGNCQTVMQQTKIIGKNNDNLCETGQNHIAVISDSANQTKIVEVCGGNGNGNDDSWILNGTFTAAGNGVTYRTTGDAVTTNQEERSRPDVIRDKNDPNIVYVALTSGNTQPPNDGIKMYAFNVGGNQPQKLWSSTIEEIDDQTNGRQRSVQVTMTQLADGSAALNWYRVGQRTRRGKGRVEGVSQVVQLSAQGAQPVGQPASYNDLMPGGDATHRAQMPLGNGSFALLSSSINGNPGAPSTLQVVCSQGGALSTGPKMSLQAAIDNGHIPQIYGNNPNNQGRGFPTGQMVMNMATQQPVFLIPATTRRMDPNTNVPEDKLAFEMIAIPSTDLACANDPAGPSVAWNGNTAGAGITMPNPGVTGGDGGVGGLGCQVGSSSSLLLVLAGLIAARRRRKA